MVRKLLIFNTVLNSGSTGRIAEEIGLKANNNGFESYCTYGIKNNNSRLKSLQVSSKFDTYCHALKSRLFDAHGLGSIKVTKGILKDIQDINPDIINLHNIHGYYLNYPILFKFLKELQIPIVWTFHDCWPLTGHCSFFDAVNCNKWQSGCVNCPNLHGYPSSLFKDNSKYNYQLKREIFQSIENLTLVAPCYWMKEVIDKSFLNNKSIRVIYNGVNTHVFKPSSIERKHQVQKKLNLKNKTIFLGVASIWDKRKGLEDFIKISDYLTEEEVIILVGLNAKQISKLPSNIIGIQRTEDIAELADIYSSANVFLNPTYVDNFPTTNIEALACGTPVVTYDTGGSPESIDHLTGHTVEKGDYLSLLKYARDLSIQDRDAIATSCRERAINLFDSQERFQEYVNLFNSSCTTTL